MVVCVLRSHYIHSTYNDTHEDGAKGSKANE